MKNTILNYLWRFKRGEETKPLLISSINQFKDIRRNGPTIEFKYTGGINPAYVGLRKEWYENGQIKYVLSYYKKGFLEGIQRYWHENGTLKQIQFNINGRTQGIIQTWKSDRSRGIIQQRHNGNLHGPNMNFFHTKSPLYTETELFDYNQMFKKY